jgi:lipopolysaccharide transport system permease protein
MPTSPPWAPAGRDAGLVTAVPQALRALWQYRGFVLGMVGREFRARYLHSLLGGAWAILNPLAMILIYTVVFSQVMGARLPGIDDRLGYGLYLCAGLLPWTYFAEVLSRGTGAFVEFAPLLKKVQFPRLTLPAIVLLAATLNFAIIFGLFLLLLVALGRAPGWAVLAFLPLLLVQQAFAVGLAFLLGALNVFYRDVAHVVAVALQFWFWFTPIVYTLAVLPEPAQRLFALNPMTALVGAYQDIVVAGVWPAWPRFAGHAAAAALVLGLAALAAQRLGGELIDEL